MSSSQSVDIISSDFVPSQSSDIVLSQSSDIFSSQSSDDSQLNQPSLFNEDLYAEI